jgi:hypothetical protein
MKTLLRYAKAIFLSFLLATPVIADNGKWPGDEIKQQAQQPQPQTQPKYQQPPQSRGWFQPPKPQAPKEVITAYMGIGVDILPQSVVSQLPSGVSSGEGIMVTRFADDSPAKKSGLQVYDIILSYDDTKLIHPKQFIDLVRKDKPTREVKLKILRNGKVSTHTVTLGMQKKPQAPLGLSIKQTGENAYVASIRFLDARGQQQLRQYRGTREQIYYQALNARDLPPKDREQILFAAGSKKGKSSSNGWGTFFPWGNRNNGDNTWGSFFPWGNKNNNDSGRGGMGSFFPFNR